MTLHKQWGKSVGEFGVREKVRMLMLRGPMGEGTKGEDLGWAERTLSYEKS